MCSNERYRMNISRKGSQQMSAGEGFFQLKDADNFLLEDSPEDYHSHLSSAPQSCLCNCGHKNTLEVPNPLKFRYYQGYLPEIEEEASMPFSYKQNWNESSPRSDQEYSYIAYPYSSRRRMRSTLDDDLEFGYSDPSSLGSRSSVGTQYLSMNSEELIMERDISESFQHMELEKDHLMRSQPSHIAFQTRARDGRKMIVYTPGKLRRTAQERFDIYNGRSSFMEPISDSRNPRYQVPQSPVFDVQYCHNNHDVLVPAVIPPKHRATSNSASELPLSSSVSVSSDETEHPQIKVGLYKTELCRSWEETGYCKYAAKCQFAHGNDDLRPVPRHPKYKTELCRSYTETGLCSYGKRCRFIHRQDSQTTSDLEKKGSRRLSIFQKLCTGAGENLPPRQP